MPSDKDPVNSHDEYGSSQQRSGDLLDLLWDIGYEPKEHLDLTAVLLDVVTSAIRSVDADGGFVVLLDESGWPSHWFVYRDGAGKLVPPFPTRNVVERGIVGWVIENRRGDLVSDLASDPRWFHLPRIPVGPGRGSALCMPLLVQERIIGVLVVVHQVPSFFKTQHLMMLQGVVDPATISIENARLYEQLRRRGEEMAALSEMALNISADQPLDRLLNTIVAQAMDLLRCRGGGLFLWQEDTCELILAASYDPEIDLQGMQVPEGEGLVGYVFETGDPLTQEEFEDLSQDDADHASRYASTGLPAATAMAVPLAWQGQKLGVLTCTDRTAGRYFDRRDRYLLTLLGQQAATTIASVQLYEQTSHRLEELAVLNETFQDIVAALDLDEILALLPRRVMDLLESSACSIALVDPETRDLVFRASSGIGADTEVGKRVPWGKGIVGAAAQSGTPVLVPDVTQDQRFFEEVDEARAEFVTQSALAVPMISRGQVVGVIEGINKSVGFNAEDERLLGAVARLAASVVESANLLAAQRERDTLRDNLTNMIVHDLRSPAGTISNSLQLLGNLAQSAESDQATQLVDIASRAAQRLMSLVDSLLDIGRLEAGQELTNRHPVSVKALIQAAVDQLALFSRRKQMYVTVESPEYLPVIMADGGMIERVLVNLINNALKFTPAGRELTVAADFDDEFVYIRVRDTGPGIPKEYQRQIFDRFTRARDRKEMDGFGLGLAFCRLAVEAHGGSIWVEGTEGKGSVFIFTLPLSKERGRPVTRTATHR